MILFFALLFVATAVAGCCAWLIFWPLTLIHLRDRHPDITGQLGPNAFLNPVALKWLMRGQFRSLGDPSLSGLATPARISVMVIVVALAMAGLLWLIFEILK